jgi:hypothetical protein
MGMSTEREIGQYLEPSPPTGGRGQGEGGSLQNGTALPAPQHHLIPANAPLTLIPLPPLGGEETLTVVSSNRREALGAACHHD